jgi:putative phosphoribosyl transferase
MLLGSDVALFRDRQDAGRRLAERLAPLRDHDPVVVGLPRGGVPVAFEVATALGVPLDVVVVRKLGVPVQPELAMGAIGEEGVLVLNSELVGALGLARDEVEAVVAREEAELGRRVRLFRGERPPVPVRGRTVILVDDGIATGSTALAAARVLRERGARRVVLAVPVGPPDAARRFRSAVDDFVCLEAPEWFFAVGGCYKRFGQTTDEEVRDLLERAHAGAAASRAGSAEPSRANGGVDWARVTHREVAIPVDGAEVTGDLRLPPAPSGLVVFAHGSGSSRLSPRNVQVAAALTAAGLGTLLFDLLTEPEAADRRNVFDVPLLAGRLVAATGWARGEAGLSALPVGYFGASTGAAAALCAAADLGDGIRAVVSRGGRPDLAAPRLGHVTAPTLLIVGGDDGVVLELNEHALAELRCPRQLAVVRGATHLFEEPGALEEVARLAGGWFTAHLVVRSEPVRGPGG